MVGRKGISGAGRSGGNQSGGTGSKKSGKNTTSQNIEQNTQLQAPENETGDNQYDYRITAILTEHFGYPPLAVIDDIINAVNHILYKCTQAMETYLLERQQQRQQEREQAKNGEADGTSSKMWSDLPADEINMGTAKLETLLEHQVDKNFDKFELYSLRNIFTLPVELIDQGYIRLKHHEHLQLNGDDKSSKADDKQINQLIKDIELELKLREILQIQVEKGQRLIKFMKTYKQDIDKFKQHYDENKTSAQLLKDLSPINDNLKFIIHQVNELVNQINVLYHKFEKNKLHLQINFKPNNRDYYLTGKSLKLLQSMGIEFQNLSNDWLLPKDQNISQQDIENLKSLTS